MSRHKGDIIINPWVSRMYNGKLNPNYATIYIGNGTCIDYNWRKVKWCGFNDANPEREYKTVGHIDIDLKAMIENVLNEVESENE